MAENSIACGVCGATTHGFGGLAEHFLSQADQSDVAHVMWLNRHVTKFEVDPATLAEMLSRYAEGRPTGGDRVAR
ncbi:MAG: C2H2 type zinc finger domain-containing protein [Acidimicrobiales bacterium]